MKSVNLVISGRVQGVNYRYFVWNKAKDLGLSGWVKNLSNGSVEVFVQGKEEDVNTLIEYCRKGTLFSKVKNIRIKDEKEKGFSDFEIIY